MASKLENAKRGDAKVMGNNGNWVVQGKTNKIYLIPSKAYLKEEEPKSK